MFSMEWNLLVGLKAGGEQYTTRFGLGIVVKAQHVL